MIIYAKIWQLDFATPNGQSGQGHDIGVSTDHNPISPVVAYLVPYTFFAFLKNLKREQRLHINILRNSESFRCFMFFPLHLFTFLHTNYLHRKTPGASHSTWGYWDPADEDPLLLSLWRAHGAATAQRAFHCGLVDLRWPPGQLHLAEVVWFWYSDWIPCFDVQTCLFEKIPVNKNTASWRFWLGFIIVYRSPNFGAVICLKLRCPFCWGRCFRQKRFCWSVWEDQRLRSQAPKPPDWVDANPIHSEIRTFLRKLGQTCGWTWLAHGYVG